MTRWIGGVLVLGGIVWLYRSLGWITQDLPLSEQKRKSSIFAPTVPKYRRTQSAKKPRNFTEWRDRYVGRKAS